MTLRRLRCAAPSVLAALALAQVLVANTGALAGALAIGFLLHGHGHALSMRPDGGHFDVVLHHGDEGGPGAPTLGAHDGDHVVHLATPDGERERPRRLEPAAGSLPVGPVLTQPARRPALAARAAPVVDVGPAARLRTVVLRL